MQSLFRDIDKQKTIEAVKEALERYQLYILREPEIKIPKVTASWSIVPPSNTNAFHSSTEDAAIFNVDGKSHREWYLKRVRWAVSRLNSTEQSIIINRYMKTDECTDYMAYMDLGMSEKTYYRKRNRAFYKLAFALRIEVYCENECEVG
jgi:ArpU family phage transcriptional regulator